jgi:hypothetical protein
MGFSIPTISDNLREKSEGFSFPVNQQKVGSVKEGGGWT